MTRPVIQPSPQGYVYLIHISPGYHHARHYVGWTRDLVQRVKDHLSGRGSPLLAACIDARIQWHVVRVWPGLPSFERGLKRQHNTARICPLCCSAPRVLCETCFTPDPLLGYFPTRVGLARAAAEAREDVGSYLAIFPFDEL